VTDSDADLVRAVLGGERAAYAALYDRHAPLIRAICHDATRDLNHAQDLAQEVFLKAGRSLGELREPDRFAAWLVGITRNQCRDWIRRQARDRHEFTDSVPDRAAGESAENDCDRTDELLQAMATLPQRDQLALHAFYLQGESAETIRGLLGLSTSGVYGLLDRARARLADLLQTRREGVR
jgi:RNA polymerase sigma-70 factor (ECF subfamily)